MKQPIEIAALLLALIAPLCAEKIQLAALFSDHMVLQREQPVPVWGLAEPGETVTVEFAGQKKTEKANARGEWRVKLDPLPAAAEGRNLTVQSTGEDRQAIITDVVVGDVWLCSGQSNMHFQMKSDADATQEIANSKDPGLRFFNVEHRFGQSALQEAKGSWNQVSPETTASCSAVAYYFGQNLRKKLDVPVGLIVSSVGGTKIESWMRPETLASTDESKALIEKWSRVSAEEFENIGNIYSAYQNERDRVHPQAVKAAKAQGTPVPPAPTAPKLRCHDCPSALHHGMIAPLQPFPIRGAIWYQGESNSGQPAAYQKLLPALIADWRRVWGSELPFLFVQLAPYRSTHPAFREAQLRIWQKTPHTAMAVTTDVGDAANIHPTRKRPIGERLALAARALSYGEKVEYSGPVFKSISIKQDRAVISFDHLGSGLVAKGDALTGFTIAGENGNFVPATATIDGSNVNVTSDKIAKPIAVRYAWAMMADGNLFNREGLPAAPFHSDPPAEPTPGEESK